MPKKMRGRTAKFPLFDMKIGDCFDIPARDWEDAYGKMQSVHGSAGSYRRRDKHVRIMTQRIIIGADVVVRVWRCE